MRESTKNSRHVEDFLFVFVHSFPRVVFIFSKRNEDIRVRHLDLLVELLVVPVAAGISRRGAKMPNVARTEKAVEQTESPSFLTFSQILVHEVDVPYANFMDTRRL